jgi:hypothetical protein
MQEVLNISRPVRSLLESEAPGERSKEGGMKAFWASDQLARDLIDSRVCILGF